MAYGGMPEWLSIAAPEGVDIAILRRKVEVVLRGEAIAILRVIKLALPDGVAIAGIQRVEDLVRLPIWP